LANAFERVLEDGEVLPSVDEVAVVAIAGGVTVGPDEVREIGVIGGGEEELVEEGDEPDGM
jgi:hypothetical protein